LERSSATGPAAFEWRIECAEAPRRVEAPAGAIRVRVLVWASVTLIALSRWQPIVSPVLGLVLGRVDPTVALGARGSGVGIERSQPLKGCGH
jgi:hypothetical protein